MNTKDPKLDSGSYINGVYTSKNGFTGSGLNCPKGTRLYNTETRCPIFFEPEDTAPGEEFKKITSDIAPDIMPYYAISNYGRVLNIKSGKIMKPNYRPNGYEYLCLAACNCKNGQKKYTTHRLVLKAFDPRDNMDELQANHVHGDKTQNYINKIMPDGTIDSGIEWATPKENSQHARDTGLYHGNNLFSDEKVKEIRQLRSQGYSYNQIQNMIDIAISTVSIQNICRNKTYHDPNYTPRSYTECNNLNPANVHKLSDEDANKIRNLSAHGYSNKDIKEIFYPNFSASAISDIVRGISHK